MVREVREELSGQEFLDCCRERLILCQEMAAEKMVLVIHMLSWGFLMAVRGELLNQSCERMERNQRLVILFM